MSLLNPIKKLSYHPFFVKTIRFLHIREPMRWAYYLLARPKDSEKAVSFEGIEVLFRVQSPLELRLVETPFQKGMGDERMVLKELIEALDIGDVAYDVGASIGIHTLFMAKKVGQKGQVIAFEPEAGSFESLRKNIRLNELNNVTPFQRALGSDFAESMLYSRGVTAGFSLLEGVKGTQGQRVKIIPGDSLVETDKLPFPKVVKIDVEGYELYVIRGLEKALRRKECRMVCCEIHPTMFPEDMKPQTITDLLKSFGFERIESQVRGETIHVFCYRS